MDRLRQWLIKKIEGCDELGEMEKEKWAFQQALKALNDLPIKDNPDAKTEEELRREFKDWLGWNDNPAPDQDDPDYYTFSWGLNVWINSFRHYNKK